MPPQIVAFFAKPLVKYGLPVVGIVLVVVGFKLWLHFHDNGVREAERARLERLATQQAEKATNVADKAQNGRNEAYEETRVDNAAGVDDYLERLRANQCKADPARCR